MAVKVADRKRLSSELKSWLDDVSAYERAFKQWEGRVEKILKRYRDDPRTGQKEWTTAKFNLLWSNVQTLSAATFSRLPKPDVSRRFRDQDPVGRVAALILERAEDYHIQHYPEYRRTMRASVLDRFLAARGTAWLRYEPHFRALPGEPVDGAQVTEDVDTPQEELDYECVAVDYVHHKDFGHCVARTWEEVPRVWRKVYMTRPMLEERFGPELAKIIPLDADPRNAAPDKAYGAQDPRDCATIFEGWDKEKKCAVWFNKSVKDFLDRKEKGDPEYVDFEDGFPCPRPLYGTLTNDSLVPVPDFVLYQDQANALDLLADRIDGLIKSLQVKGVYDASIPELGRLFTEGENGTLIPGKNWAQFAQKNGLVGSLSLVDLKPIAEALTAAYEAFEQVKNQVYEITGISDIIRGQTQASETATAQQIKGQYASLRLRTYQDEVAVYASEILALMAQVICRKFSPQTIAKIAGAEQLSPQDQQHVQDALALLVGPARMQDPNAEEGPNPVREFRIEVAADSMVQLDEQAEQQSRTEFLTATSVYLQNVAKSMAGVAPQQQAVLIPLLMDMLKFGVTGFKVGKQIEGSFEAAAEQLKQLAQAAGQAPPPPNPEMVKAQMEQQSEQARMQQEAALQAAKQQSEDAIAAREHEREQMRAQMEHQREQDRMAMEERQKQLEGYMTERENQRQEAFERWKAELDASTKITVAEIAAKASLDASLMKAEQAANDELNADLTDGGQAAQSAGAKPKRRSMGIDRLAQMHKDTTAASDARHAELMRAHAEHSGALVKLAEAITKPKTVIRGPDGKVQGIQ